MIKQGTMLAGALMLPWAGARRVFAQTASFDFYISPTGSDSAPGTLSQPWSITALNKNGSIYAGKSVGIMDGTYNVYALCQNSTSGNAYPALTVAAGSASAPTLVAAVNPRKAILDAHNPSGGAYPTVECSIIGQNPNSLGNCIIDGLYLTGSYEGAIQFPATGTGEGGPTGIVVRNCEIYDIAGYENDNIAGIHLHSVTGALVQNNLIHKVHATSGQAGHNTAAILTFNCSSNIYEYNTVYDCVVGIYDKNPPNGGHTYRYNYLECTGYGPLVDCSGGSAGQVVTVHNNILIGPQTSDGEDITTPSSQSLLFYNNTCSYSGPCGVYYPSAGSGTSPAAVVKQYNNIFYNSNTSGNGIDTMYQRGAVTLSDYNCYSTQPGDTPMGFVQAPTAGTLVRDSLTTLTAMPLDTHSFAAKPVFQSATTKNPAGYQLQAGSQGIQAGRVGGVSGGTPCNIGAWDGVVTRIGCGFGPGAVSSVALPNPPSSLTVD